MEVVLLVVRYLVPVCLADNNSDGGNEKSDEKQAADACFAPIGG
jgi:hypothetical protein